MAYNRPESRASVHCTERAPLKNACSERDDVAKRANMSKAEMEIARIVWQLKSASARQVHGALPKSRKIDFTTVQTYLTRLEEKGYIKSKKEGRAKIFSAKANPDRVIRDTIHELVDLLFDGNAVPMMRHLISDTEMSSDDVDSLREMLDELEDE